jgi:hypothetical protein
VVEVDGVVALTLCRVGGAAVLRPTKEFWRGLDEGNEFAGREGYCGNCLMLVTRSPVKRIKTVLEGGWP